MILGAPDGVALLKMWEEAGSWVYIQTNSLAYGEQQFWGRVARVSERRVCFAGEKAWIPVRLTDCIFEHIASDEIPELLRERFKDADCCLFMRFATGAALVYGKQSRMGFCESILQGQPPLRAELIASC
jgi:hypothetical protein